MDDKTWLPAGLCAVALLCGSVSAQAVVDPTRGDWTITLLPRDLDGDGVADAWYDRVLNITWLGSVATPADVANWMTWDAANAWAGALTVGGVGGWRLPRASIEQMGLRCNNSDTDNNGCGHNVAALSSELAHLYYTTLGNVAYLDTSGRVQSGWEALNTGPFDGPVYLGTDGGQFNIVFWAGSAVTPSDRPYYQFGFHAGSWAGRQYSVEATGLRLVWAVHDGDVGTSPVPEPPPALLLAAGVALLAWRRRAARRGQVAE